MFECRDQKAEALVFVVYLAGAKADDAVLFGHAQHLAAEAAVEHLEVVGADAVVDNFDGEAVGQRMVAVETRHGLAEGHHVDVAGGGQSAGLYSGEGLFKTCEGLFKALGLIAVVEPTEGDVLVVEGPDDGFLHMGEEGGVVHEVFHPVEVDDVGLLHQGVLREVEVGERHGERRAVAAVERLHLALVAFHLGEAFATAAQDALGTAHQRIARRAIEPHVGLGGGDVGRRRALEAAEHVAFHALLEQRLVDAARGDAGAAVVHGGYVEYFHCGWISSLVFSPCQSEQAPFGHLAY